jgi:CRISPR-associated protein Cmr6
MLVENKTEDDADFVAIFGRAPRQGEPESAAQSGHAIFLDAIPTHVPELQLDIMNPHFPDYYGDDPKRPTKYPTDWQSPKPVFFLTVAPNTEFCFAVGWRGAANEPLQKRAQEWLTKGLQELGAGAKTSAGYGYFKADGAVEQTAQVEKVVQTAAPVTQAEPARPTRVRRGTIIEIRSDARGFGRVRDFEDNHEYHFSISVIQGQTPGKKQTVEFELDGEKVVKVRKV